MASRSHVLAPKRRTGSGSRSAGTQTMCMSEWTSMPAAWGCWMVSVTGWARGARETGWRAALAAFDGHGERLRWLMATTTFRKSGVKIAGAGQEGNRDYALSPTGSTPRRAPGRVTNDRVAASRARLNDGHAAPHG